MSSSELSSVGIDGVAVYVPRLYVDLTSEWAEARAPLQSSDPATLVAKLTRGIGVRKMAVPDAHEDSATMAAMAAKRLIDRLGINPADIGYLAIGTETTVDQSKSIAAYVLGMLSRHYGVDLSHVGCPQVQFACVGATYALEAAAALIRSGSLEGRSALVIATDIACYAIGGPAECTQGAGAVALRVSAAPRLLELEPRSWCSVTLDERDFFRPNWSTEAVVDGQHSVDTYLRCLDGVLGSAARASAARARGARDALTADYYLFHTPFPRMAEYAAARLYRRLEALEQGIGPDGWGSEPERERNADRARCKTEVFQAWFAARCGPGLRSASEIGNIYSGALYLSLADLIESLGERGSSAVGRRVLCFSYGSGASAKLFAGTIRPEFTQTAHAARLSGELGSADSSGRRRSLRLAEYHRLHGLHGVRPDLGPVNPSVVAPNEEFALLRYGSESSPQRVDLGYRYYDFVEQRSIG